MTAMIRDIGILSHETQCCLMFGHVVGVGACKRGGLPVWLLRTDCPRLTINIRLNEHYFFIKGFEWTISCDISLYHHQTSGCYKPVRLATRFGFTGCLSHEPMASHGHLPHGHEPPDPQKSRQFGTGQHLQSPKSWHTLPGCQALKIELKVIIDICCELRLEFSCQWGKYQNITHPKTSRLIGSRRSAYTEARQEECREMWNWKAKHHKSCGQHAFMIPRILHFHVWLMVDLFLFVGNFPFWTCHDMPI